MKRLSIHIVLIIASFLVYGTASAQLLQIGFYGGLSTPNDKVSDIYNGDISVGKMWSEGKDAGYHLGVKGRISLSDNIDFVGGIGYNKFPESKIEVKDPTTDTLLLSLTSTTNIVPINAGINLYLFRSVVGVYATGDITYNYITSSIDYNYKGVDVPLSKTPADSRMGFGLGAGMDLKLGLVVLNLEGKYHSLNLIGKADKEKDKSYFSLSLGVYF